MNIQKAIENGPFIDGLPGFTWVYLSKMVIFHCYVSSPEGIPLYMVDTSNQSVPEMLIDGKMMFPW